MDLGKSKLLRTGLNALYQAIHPIHGIAWTDGKQVILMTLQLQNQEPKFGNSRIIGQFEHVHGLTWSPPGVSGSPTLLAVQHKKHVTVWQLCASPSERSKLLVSQTCEIGEPFPVLPQGCVWHPHKAILTVLTSRDVSVLHSVHCDNSRVKADLVKVHGFVHCACWTRDGQRLVVAVGSALHSFTWDEAQKALHLCSCCPVFEVGSPICSVLATVDMQIAVATELPLDKICSLGSMEALEISPSSRAGSTQPPFADPRKTTGNSEPSSSSSASISSSSLDSLVLSQILPRSSRSDSNSLFNLRDKDCLSAMDQDSSHLVLVTFDRMVTATRKVGIPGILVPDMLAFDPRSQVVAVASNMCHIILIYALGSSLAPSVQCIRLESCERPKGICFLSDKRLLILVGKQKFTDPTFLPSSKSDRYTIRLVIREISFEEEPSWRSVWSQQDFCNVKVTLGMPTKKKLGESHYPIFYPPRKELLLPGSLTIHSRTSGKTLIEEISEPSQSSRFNSPPPPTAASAERLETGPGLQPAALPSPHASPNSPKNHCRLIHEPLNLPQGQAASNEKEESRLCATLDRLSGNFTDLHQRLSELLELLRNQKQSPAPTSYPHSQDPCFLLITCQKPSSAGPVVDKRAVLLCEGKLRLQMVQQMFGISLVEMQHGSLWILLSADSEGFIPLIFSASQEIIIRDGSGGDGSGSNSASASASANGSANGLGSPTQ